MPEPGTWQPGLSRSAPEIVVTRPAPDHESLIAAVTGNGIEAIHCPAFALEPAAPDRLERVRAGLGAFDLAVVTSPAAARVLADTIEVRDVSATTFATPGRGTASILEAAGISARFPGPGGTSEQLLALPEFERVEGRRVAIVGAAGGRRLLGDELGRRGAHVERLHVYRRRPLSPARELVSALRAGRTLVVLVSSVLAFDTITDALPAALRPAWFDALFVVSSRRIEQRCRECGVQRIRRAAGAGDREMLEALASLGAIDRGE